MARILNKIVYSTTPPRNENDLWINNGVFYMYKAGEWVPVKHSDANMLLDLKYVRGTEKISFYTINYSHDELKQLTTNNIGIIVTFGDGKYYYPEITVLHNSLVLKCEILDNTEGDPTLTLKKVAIAQGSKKEDLAVVTSKTTILQSKLTLSTINGHALDTGENIIIEGGTGGSTIVVEDKLDNTSSNPVQNKVITNKFNEIETILTWNNHE